jgi:hypothetical protein
MKMITGLPSLRQTRTPWACSRRAAVIALAAYCWATIGCMLHCRGTGLLLSSSDGGATVFPCYHAHHLLPRWTWGAIGLPWLAAVLAVDSGCALNIHRSCCWA